MNFANIKDVTVGTTLVADGGFPCIKPGVALEVQANDAGDLYVPCHHGRHYLDGQIDNAEGVLVGLSIEKSA